MISDPEGNRNLCRTIHSIIPADTANNWRRQPGKPACAPGQGTTALARNRDSSRFAQPPFRSEEIGKEGGAALSQDTANHLAAVIQTGIAEQMIERLDGARLGVVAQGLPTVGVFEPGALLLRQRARRSVGVVARRVLGRRAPAVRSYLRRVARLLRRAGGARP